MSRSAKRTWLPLILFVVTVSLLISPFAWSRYQKKRIESFKDQARTASVQKNWEELKQISGKWLGSFPDSNDALLFLAEAEGQLGQIQKSADLLKQVDEEYPGALQALLIRSELLFTELNQTFEAEACWKRMLSIDPKADAARKRLIYFYAMTLQRSKMEEHIREAIRLNCEPPEAYSYLLLRNRLNFSDGLTLVTRWRVNDTKNEILEVAQAIYAAKKTANNTIATFGIQTIVPGDRTLLNRTLKKYPHNLELLALQIEIKIFEGDVRAVSKWLSQADEEAEADGRFWRYRGWLLTQQQDFAKAEESLERALRLNPFDWQARLQLGVAQRRLEKPEQADRSAELASIGKSLQDRILELSSASDLTFELLEEVYEYSLSVGETSVANGIERRIY